MHAHYGLLCILLIQDEKSVYLSHCGRGMQAYNLSRDHKPDLEVERERILKAGGFIHAGRVNGSLNLARAIGTTLACLCTIWFSFSLLQSNLKLSP